MYINYNFALDFYKFIEDQSSILENSFVTLVEYVGNDYKYGNDLEFRL